MAKIDLSADELRLIFECVYQCACHDDDLLAEHRKLYNMTFDECDNLTITLREKIHQYLSKDD